MILGVISELSKSGLGRGDGGVVAVNVISLFTFASIEKLGNAKVQ